MGMECLAKISIWEGPWAQKSTLERRPWQKGPFLEEQSHPPLYSLRAANSRKIPPCASGSGVGRGHVGPWVGEKHTDFQQLALLLPPTAEKGQESWKNTRPSRDCQKPAVFPSSGSSALGSCWHRIGFSLSSCTLIHSGSVPAPNGGSAGWNSRALYDREVRWPPEVTEKRDAGPGSCKGSAVCHPCRVNRGRCDVKRWAVRGDLSPPITPGGLALEETARDPARSCYHPWWEDLAWPSLTSFPWQHHLGAHKSIREIKEVSLQEMSLLTAKEAHFSSQELCFFHLSLILSDSLRFGCSSHIQDAGGGWRKSLGFSQIHHLSPLSLWNCFLFLLFLPWWESKVGVTNYSIKFQLIYLLPGTLPDVSIRRELRAKGEQLWWMRQCVSVARCFWTALWSQIFYPIFHQMSLTLGLTRLGLILQGKMQKVLGSYASGKKWQNSSFSFS